jgi:hypothetical protein
MVSGKATEKSVSPGAHAHAIANIDALFERAAIHDQRNDRDNNPNIKQIHQLGALMEYDGVFYPIKITVKEYALSGQANKVYLIEAVDVENIKKEAPRSMKDDPNGILPPPLKSFSFDKRLARLLARVNPDFTMNSSGPGGKLRGQDNDCFGYTRLTPDAYRIVLGKNANLSTLLYFFVGHERSRNESEPAYRAPLKILGICLGTTILMIFFIV